MIKPFTCLTVLLAASSGLYLYSEKHRTTLLDGRIRAVVADTGRIEDRTAMLRAEWALLNQPDRLQSLAARFLPQLQPMAPTQFVPVAELDKHLPAEGPPPAPAVPAGPVVPGPGIAVAAARPGAAAVTAGAPAVTAGAVGAAGAVTTAVAGAAEPAAGRTVADKVVARPAVVRVAAAARVRRAPAVARRVMVASLAPRLPVAAPVSLVRQVSSFAPPAPMLASSWRAAPASAPAFSGSALGMAHGAAMAPPMAAR